MTSDLSFDPSIPLVDENSETDELIYRISHDLRASVRALQELPSWIAEDLEKGGAKLPSPSERHLELIASHACRLDLMLTGLLEYSRIGRRQPIAPIKPVDVLADVVEDLGISDSVRLNTDIDGGSIQMGDNDLRRVFSILLTNAVRFHPKHTPRIDFTGGPINGREWEFSATDDGPGIPADKHDFVQQPMTKLVSRDIDPGAGMGLAMLRKIAQVYGGSVKIGAGKAGRGTRVQVRVAVN